MGEGEHRFRGSAFGFNRQDVIRYIESIHQEYNARLQALEKALEEERHTRSAAEENQSKAGQEAAAAGADAQRAREEMGEAMAALDALRRERDELRLRLQIADKEYSDLQLAADRMAPAARAYEALKDKAAGIEMEARTRAETIVQDGERRAGRIRQEAVTWARRVESSYSRIQSDVAATITHAVGELERTGRSLDGVTEELRRHGDSLHTLAEETAKSAESGKTGSQP